MKRIASISLILCGLAGLAAAQNSIARGRELERGGDAVAARALLQHAAKAAPNDPATLAAYADFLDRYHDVETRDAYEKTLALLGDSGNRELRRKVARRLVILDLIDGDRGAAAKHLDEYHAAGGKDWAAGLPKAKATDDAPATMDIPGPLGSFSRMAGLSPDISPEDVLPALARNVVTSGYQALSSGETLEPTEYMKLLIRYVSQARELSKLAGEKKVIQINACESAETGELLRILGYRMRGGCGSDVVLETVNASRAFLTVDSGFPLAQLEQALRTNRPFQYLYAPTRVPALYGADYWLSTKDKQTGDFLDAFLADPGLCRAYLAVVKLDGETAAELRKQMPVAKLRAFAHVMDFFGGMFEIRGGRAMVPGGARAAAMWGELVGVSPDQGAAFFDRLVAKDDGWMASYFDALARVSGPVQDFLTDPQRLKRFYMAIRGRVTSPGPARPVFRANTDMMLLTTRLRLDSSGQPHIPGSLDVWKNLFANHPHASKYDSRLSKAAVGWKNSDDLLEALFGLCRKQVENEPLKIYLAVSNLDARRAKPLEPATVDRLAREWRSYGSQYSIFSESPELRDATIIQYLDTARTIARIGDQLSRADTAGTMQALVGLWAILVRQGSIPAGQCDTALAEILQRFGNVRGSRELFDAGREGVTIILKASGTPADAPPQDRLLQLLAGTASAADSATETQMVQDMVRILEAQRLISLNVLFEFADSVGRMRAGEKVSPALVNRIQTRIADIQAPRASLTTAERSTLSFGYWAERHIDGERRINLKVAVERAGADAEKLNSLRGLLAPLLRDTLVGLNYAHYAPPGAQLLLTNPAFVRSHDLIGIIGTNETWKYTEVVGSGWPTSAGGRLMGSLSGLPYALAEAEQNFLIPEREQALIWGDLAPQMIVTAKVPRWWNVTPAQMHWVALHMRSAESLMAEAALDSAVREKVIAALDRYASPGRVQRAADLLAQGDVRTALEGITPSELFLVARTLVVQEHSGTPFGTEITALQREDPGRVNYEAIARAFGTPKPTLTNSYHTDLLNIRTFPTMMGYSSRLMAESWESTILYWAALADEVHVAPGQLNLLIPEWTQKTLEKIFATNLEDWPAVLRSMRGVGEDVRLKLRMQMSEGEQKASLQ